MKTKLPMKAEESNAGATASAPVEVTAASGFVDRLGLGPITDRVAAELANQIKGQFLAAAAGAHAAALPAGSYAAIFRAYLNRMKAEDRDRMQGQAAELARSDAVHLRAIIGQPALPTITSPSRFALPADLATSLKKRLSLVKVTPPVFPPIKLNEPRYKRVGFYITKVSCVEETDEIGSDEILLSGVGVYPTGEVVQPAVWKVSDDFDTGEAVVLAPPRTYVEFDLAKGTQWPKTYVITVVLAEEDSGGFGDFLQDLWSQVGKDASNAVGAAVGGAAGTKVGSTLGGIIGQVVAEVFGAIIGWLVSLFHNPDDLIGTQSWVLTLASDTKKYCDGLHISSPVVPGPMKFIGDGGNYEVNLLWKVS